MFAVTELEQPLWRIAKHTMLYPEDKRLPEDIVLAGEDFKVMAKVLDDYMSGREFIVGDSISFADCTTAYVLDWGDEAGLLDDFPNLKHYLKHMYGRPNAPQRIAEAFKELQAA